ncbi:hypothetical protein HO173_011090 [Letharia columbiana]|uniref:Uncharacterized protein n=1 Tax=Letharia columbiana TaxID=112416 RepID=A0A8H6FLJ0_9LECA|nr:uncharacterized protein HO173_011090 [Letharia columbiana]KAF6230738.1 hypothetical protein HO173_011090 [Letharia columbiana]
MSQESNAGSRRTEGGLANALEILTVGHQPRQSEHLRSDKVLLGEVQRHIGRLEEKIEQNRALLLQKDREISDLDHANKDVHDDLAQHKTRLRKVETEKQLLLHDISHLNQEIDAKSTALKKSNDDFVKAQKTIKVQSDLISGAKDGPKPHGTPQRFGPPAGAYSQVYNQPPPAYNAPSGRFPHAQAATAAQHTAPGLRRQSSNHPTFQPQPLFSTPANQRRPSVTPPAYNPYQSQQGVLVRQDTDQASGVDLIGDFTPHFHLIETWTHNYVSVPDQHKDQFISDSLRNCLAVATDPRTAMKLMTSSKTRPLLIARVINQLIVDFAFRPMLLRGFSPFYDNKISSFRGQLMGNIPSNVRRALLLACAETVVDMTQAEGFEGWMDRNITPKVHDMWHLLQPLFAHGTPRDAAWNDLNRIWREATRIGILMLSKPCIYTLDFPPMGPNSYFNPSNMCNRDQDFTQNPQALSSMAVSVRLAITPIITETDFMKDAIEAKCLHQAMVLLAI